MPFHRPSAPWAVSLAALCALLTCIGCGPGLGSPVKVSGTVTVDDKPLGNALVTFHCSEERAAEFRSFMATTGADGTYAIEEIYPGKYEVSIAEGGGESGEGMDDPGMASATAGQELQPADGGALQTEIGSDDVTYDVKLKRGRAR